jgi:ClpX C4-type zinc finger
MSPSSSACWIRSPSRPRVGAAGCADCHHPLRLPSTVRALKTRLTQRVLSSGNDRRLRQGEGKISMSEMLVPAANKSAHCTFCRRSRGRARALIAAPAVTICDRCVARASHIARGATSTAESCSFCRAEIARCRFTVPGYRICDVCIDLCIEILREESGIDVTQRAPWVPWAIARFRSRRGR